MKAVLIHELGSPDVLQLEEIERPNPGQGEILVRVRAASVNPVDWKRRRGLRDVHLPAVLGRDFSGLVEVSRAEGFAQGDEVFGIAASGGYAELATTLAEAIVKKPDAVTHEQAAALPIAGMTAWQALFDRGGLEAGGTVLIAAAAGGVGHLAVQLAKLAGARVIGTGSSRNRGFVLGLGADEYVDYTSHEVTEVVRGVDLAVDNVAGDTTSALLPCVRDGGTLITIAAPAPEEEARARGVRAERILMTTRAEQLARLGALVAAGDLHVEIEEVLPLAEIRRAHELSEAGHVRGKLVLAVG